MTKAINENRLFSLLPFFFDNPAAIVVEIAQNAQRSGATRLDITLKDGVLETSDNGSGADNQEPLFVLADSNWSEEVEENQKPAGWGLFFLYSIAETVSFASGFGTVEIDCKKYLSDGDYRKDILKGVNTKLLCVGFSIKAVLRAEIKNNLLENIEEKLCWFPLDVVVNGKPVVRKQAEKEFEGYSINTVYEGNRVYIDARAFLESSERLRLGNLLTLWYGIPVKTHRYSSSSSSVVLDVTKGAPLTPVLPFRASIKADEKFDAFWKFVKSEVVAYSIKYVNDTVRDTKDNKAHLMACFNNVALLGTQDDLDRLERFYYVVMEPHFERGSRWCDEGKAELIRKGDAPPVDEKLLLEGLDELFEKDNFDHDSGEDVFLPEGTIKSIRLRERRPSWLKVKTVTRTIRVTAKDTDRLFCKERFNWAKCSIETDCNEAIKVLAVVSDSQDGYVFYVDNPADFSEISEPVFDRRVYYEDGAEWDNQWFEFEREVENDVAAITGKFELYKLLDGLLVAGIAPQSVVTIKVKGKIMTVKTNQEVKQLQLS